MRTIALSHIYDISDKRPPGYVDALLALGEVKGRVLHVTNEKGFQRLRQKYAKLEQFQAGQRAGGVAMVKHGPEQWGPPLWDRLHAAAAGGQLTPEWIEEFTKHIPCGECRRHWMEMLKATPPPFDDPAAQYQWSVDRHNSVNRRLGKAAWNPPQEPSSVSSPAGG